MAVNLSEVAVEFFPYRTAHVSHQLQTVPRERLRSLEEALSEKVGLPHRDNHVVFKLTHHGRNGVKTTCFHFTNDSCVIGREAETR